MGLSATAIDPARGAALRPIGQLLGHREATFWALQALGWSAYFIAQYISVLVNPERLYPEHLSKYLYVLVVAATSGFVLSSLLRYAYRRVRDRSPAIVIATVLVLVYAAALIWKVLINGAYLVFLGQHDIFDSWARVLATALIQTYLLLCWSALYFGIYYYESVQREREATLRANALAQEAQMKMLRYQLNPHFLFNTLNAISTLVLDRDNERANLAVTRLSAFLRHTLDQDPMKKVTLKQELEALDLYLGIEQLRFGSRLRLQYDVDRPRSMRSCRRLLLQPLIENALKYAIAPAETGRHAARRRTGHRPAAAAARGRRRPRASRAGARIGDRPRRRPQEHAGAPRRCCTASARASRHQLNTALERLACLRNRRDRVPAARATFLADGAHPYAAVVTTNMLARRGLEHAPRGGARPRGGRRVRERPRGGRDGRQSRPGPDVPRHPDAGLVRLRRAGAPAAGFAAGDVFVTAFDRYAIDAFEARAARLPAEARRGRAPRARPRRACAAPATSGRRSSSATGCSGCSPTSRRRRARARAAAGARRKAPPSATRRCCAIRTGRESCASKRRRSTGSTPPATTCASMPAGETHVLRATMKQLETALDPQIFQRVHRSAIVNLRRVRKLRPHANGEYFLTLETGQELKLSRTHRDKVELLLGGTLNRPA